MWKTIFAGVGVLACCGAGAVEAQQAGSTKAPPNAQEYILDLKDGARVPPTFHIHFGLLNMGVAPAGVEFPKTGHHHLLIDAPLPPLNEPIPADDNHIHYGGGQTEADVTLPPGPHTLQLLMGDHGHVPHNPPVYSSVVHITVVAPRTPSRPGADVYFISPHDGDVVPTTMTVRFGLRGMGVAPAGVTRANAGHHHLIIDAATPGFDDPIPADDQHVHFGNGQTETDVQLTPGKHTLQLVLGDDKHVNFDPPVMSKVITVTVREQKATR